jgi:hypothetical protein
VSYQLDHAPEDRQNIIRLKHLVEIPQVDRSVAVSADASSGGQLDYQGRELRDVQRRPGRGPGPFNRASGQPSPKYMSMKERSEVLSALFPQGPSGNQMFTRLRDIAVEMLNCEHLDDEQMGFE